MRWSTLAALLVAVGAMSGCQTWSRNTGDDATAEAMPWSDTDRAGSCFVEVLQGPGTEPAARSVADRFLKRLRREGVFERVSLDTGQPLSAGQWRLQARVTDDVDPSMGSNVTKAFFIGFTLFLLAPVLPMQAACDSAISVDLHDHRGGLSRIEARGAAKGYSTVPFLGVSNARNAAEAEARDSCWADFMGQVRPALR